MQTTETLARLAHWREKAADGTLTIEEMREAITTLREGRISAAFISAAARKAKEVLVLPTAEDLIRELQALITQDDTLLIQGC